jgi:hypothetical protein
LPTGRLVQLFAKLTLSGSGPGPGNNNADYSWTTSDQAIVTFTEGGAAASGPNPFIKGVAVGTATITLTVGAVNTTLTVNVVAADTANVSAVSIGLPSF